MRNQILLTSLHASLMMMKKKLISKGLVCYGDDIARIEAVINQYPKLSRSSTCSLFANTDEPPMLQAISAAIECIANKIHLELILEAKTIETEMHGTQNFSDYELKRTENYVLKKEFNNELKKMIKLIATESIEFNELDSNDLYLLPKR